MPTHLTPPALPAPRVADIAAAASSPPPSPSTDASTGLPQPTMGELLDAVDSLAARRPVAARLVAMTGDDNVGSKELAATLTADVSLTARVVKLANSAYYGLGGRVRTIPFAITVVGFSTIRAMAATAAAGIDTNELLPADFWPRSKATALASSELAPLFSVPAPDAFCLGLLAGLGQAILVQHDPAGYRQLLDASAEHARTVLVDAEVERYGLRHTEVSAAVLSSWAFPHDLSEALHHLDSPTGLATPWSLCLATAVEAATRLVCPDVPVQDVLQLSQGAVTEDRLLAMLPRLSQAVGASDW